MQLINDMKCMPPEVYAVAMMYVCTYCIGTGGGAYSLTHTVPFHSDITFETTKVRIKIRVQVIYVYTYEQDSSVYVRPSVRMYKA